MKYYVIYSYTVNNELRFGNRSTRLPDPITEDSVNNLKSEITDSLIRGPMNAGVNSPFGNVQIINLIKVI